MATNLDLDGYTLHFMVILWHYRFLHILYFLCFADNSQRQEQGKEYDWLWELKTIIDPLDQAYAKFYDHSEHLAVDELVVKFKGSVIFRQYIPKQTKCFSNRIYKLWWMRAHMWHESVLG
jgi:hypothetical protein